MASAYMKKLTEKDLQKILKYYTKDEYSMAAIAKKMGVAKITVRYHLHRMKVKIRSVSDYKREIP
jgi:predicted DNA-binding protein YlxM (UPF0122 family)